MSIDENAMRAAYAALAARVTYLEKASGLFVDDDALDKPHADIKIHFDPRLWRGASHKGRQASECTPEFLEAYAEALQYMAEHPKEGADAKKIAYNKLDAARCRSWARRNRRTPRPTPSLPANGALYEEERDLFGDDEEEDIFP